ncbi:MAG: DUF4416 family protein [Deltaproteobacteria bacterium]|nr:DUF4416 family protein [Deltaproteobacteria bacterium]
MGTPTKPLPAALVVSVLFADGSARDEALRLLEGPFGAGEVFPEVFPFDFTGYYTAEMGAPLRRVLWMAEGLAERDTLAAIKLTTNGIETSLQAPDGRRRVNIDPGLLTAENLVLATTKPYSHRVFLRDGIFADLTLVFRDGAFAPLPWTYPDYSAPALRNALKTLRSTYIKRLRARE